MIAGLDEKTHGDCHIAKKQNGSTSEIGMIFQEHGLFPWMSLRKNIGFILENNPRIKRNEVETITTHYLEKVGLEQHAQLYPHQVSGGMKQRISIARSFANDSDVLLMDEPFVFLDFQARLLIHELLINIWRETQKTILFVTHDVEEAVVLADRIIVLTAHPGQIRQIETVNIKRPRDSINIKKDPAFIELVSQLTQEIKTDIQINYS